MTFAVVTGGGTSGHVLPALAVADSLVALGRDPAEIHYVGAARGIETRLVPETGYPHTFFDVVGVQRRLSRRNLAFVPKLWRARSGAIRLLRRLAPAVVVSVGGYASLPVVLAARRLRIPIVVVSYDLLPGWASRVAARWAAACAVAFPESPLPRAVVTGAPVRQAVLDVDRDRDRARARADLGVPDDRFLVAVMGGSQGSGVLNDAVEALLQRFGDDVGLAIRHVVGERFAERAAPARDGAGGVWYRPVPYEPDMPTVYAAADLLIGRGGASTVHEVAVTGIPAVLVPWAGSAEDHQTQNDRWLSDKEAAVHLPETQLDRLPRLVEELRADGARRAGLSAAATTAGELHRSGALAKLIVSIAEGAGWRGDQPTVS